MSKKFTSFMVLLAMVLLTLPSHAQVQTRKAVSGKDSKAIIRGAKVALKNSDQMAKAKDAAAMEAGNIVTVPFKTWDWEANAPQQFVPTNAQPVAMAQVGKALAANLAASQRTLDNVSGGSRFAATTDAHGIITAPDEGESKLYTREGMTFSYNSATGQVSLLNQSGSVEIVELEDGTVYIKDIISTLGMDTWVKGTKSGNTITVEGGQPVAWNTTYNTTMSVNWGEYDGGYFTRSTGDITFTVDGDVITLNDAETYDHFIGLYWDDDDSWQAGYGDYATVWTEGYEGPSMELIELPEGAEVENWFVLAGTTNSGNVPTNVDVAFVDDEVYMKGLFTQIPNVWIKGTKTGNSVAVPKLQYLGTYGQYDLWTWTGTIPTSDGYYLLDEVTFTYDEAAQTLTLDEDQALVATADPTRWYALDYYTELQIGAFEPIVEPIVAPYFGDFSSASTFKDFVVLDNNGDGRTWAWNTNGYAQYTYSGSNKADDYLILPIELDANQKYKVTLNAASNSTYYKETFEVKVGKVATPAGLNMTAIEETTVSSGGVYADYDGEFTTDEAGTWYVAIHATSIPNQYYLYVKSLTIDAVPAPTAPGAPTLAVEVGPEGELSLSGTVTAPTTTVDGNRLTSGITKVNVLCDGKVLTTIYNMNPGTSKKFIDEPTPGLHTYSAVPYGKDGIGQKSEVITVWIGPDAPADVENVVASVAEAADKITFTWDAVTAAHGGYLDAANVTYSVVELEYVDMGWLGGYFDEGATLGTVTGATTTTVTYPADQGDEQGYTYFAVKATANGSTTDPTSVDADIVPIVVGAPDELPVEESFEGMTLHYNNWFIANVPGLYVSEDASDGDGVAFALFANYFGDADFFTGKLKLQQAANATVLFDAKKGTSEAEEISVFARTPDGEDTILGTFTLTDEYQNFKVVIPEEVKNARWAHIGFRVNFEDNGSVLIDNIKVLDFYQYDASVAVEAPKSVVAGKTATVTATVKNEGENAITGYTVTVKAGENVLLEETVNEELKSFETKVLTADFVTNIFDEAADVNITATVAYANDLNPDNDEAKAVISITEPTATGVANVSAWTNDNRVVVYWTAPSIDAPIAEEVTESFEEGDGGWTFIDSDGDGYNWRRVVFVDDNDNPVGSHDGDYSVMSQSWVGGVGALRPDNWLVSPEVVLDGTFKFWAEGVDPDYAAEHFQVYVSTTDPTDVTTFEAVSQEFIATGDWKEYTVDLSAYAGVNGWIAIRHFNVTDEYALEVDEITYLVGGGALPEIAYYNIYLDGEFAVKATANQMIATIENVENGTHTVAVSVVYANGQESKPVETTVTVSTATGLNQINVLTQPVDVYSLDGKLVRKQTTSFDGLKGVYVVDGKKVVLK